MSAASEMLQEMRDKSALHRLDRHSWPIPQLVEPIDLDAWADAIEAELAANGDEITQLEDYVGECDRLRARVAELEAMVQRYAMSTVPEVR